MRRALALLALLAGAHALAQDDAATRAAEEAKARRQLEQVRAEIRTLTDAQRATQGQREDATRGLREQELAIAAVARELVAIQTRRGEQQRELDALNRRRAELTDALGRQREALAALLRSAYALGRHEELKLLLQQDDVAGIARVLAYHRYFQRARLGRIDALTADLEQLAEVQRQIELHQAELDATQAAQEAENRRLAGERATRAELLGALEATLKTQTARLAALGKDEGALLGLIEKLRDVFADIPRQLGVADAFASLRGRLSWPLQGKLLTGFGATDESGRRSAGWRIAAAASTPVQAIAHGRVVFADWFKGYGLLLIVDHGEDYLSLYGYNEALLKDVGDWVASGEPVARSGVSGGQSVDSLYFELRHKGKPIDPKVWLKR
ncbi:MAG TPA: peptidoglycan DD-metalloendopeptidase family protein [Dokdonella sp.]|uniref:murein hydrolase activator EnvC family protein n=1 Tax=Dokdonella sp. TaxID=2291710 RepID=UPI002C9E8BC3|nr:peptidoglycan DD-metalloendopeptidase family protein [Dokdonella sp.]HUD40491.1 peptidoglycan DD-metalloendopeptidase family protein [Dokdonella sp.]